MSKIGKINTLAAITLLLATLTASDSTAQTQSPLEGRWMIIGCDIGVSTEDMYRYDSLTFHSEVDKCAAAGFPQNMELLRDGTGIVDGNSNSWKTQDNRVYFMGSPAKAFGYKISSSALFLINDSRNSTVYLEPSAAQAHTKKVVAKRRKQAERIALELETQRRKDFESTGYFTDSRDGHRYRSVKIGNRIWMAENLNYRPESGKHSCYQNDNSYCNEYGRLYDWNTAKTACPSGWHLPSREEWGELAKTAGGTGAYGAKGNAGKKLKAKNGWERKGNGTDEYGFSALPGGIRIHNGDDSYDHIGRIGLWWTATGFGSNNVWVRGVSFVLKSITEVNWEHYPYESSVRCVYDGAPAR
jgi:uncharacterized protein (TIGR02145 family)